MTALACVASGIIAILMGLAFLPYDLMAMITAGIIAAVVVAIISEARE